MKPVCVACEREMKTDKVGVTVMLKRRTPDGDQVPYQAFHADLLKCSGCGFTIAYSPETRPFWGSWAVLSQPVCDFVVPEIGGVPS